MSNQPPLRGDGLYRDEVVRIGELTVNTALIRGYEFTNCRVVGPAVLGLLGNVQITHCSWDVPSLDAMFWEVPAERGPVIGVVGVQDAVFSNCSFELIGVAGPPEMRAMLESGFNGDYGER